MSRGAGGHSDGEFQAVRSELLLCCLVDGSAAGGSNWPCSRLVHVDDVGKSHRSDQLPDVLFAGIRATDCLIDPNTNLELYLPSFSRFEETPERCNLARSLAPTKSWRARAIACRVVAFITTTMVPAAALLRVGVGVDPGEFVGDRRNGQATAWHGGSFYRLLLHQHLLQNLPQTLRKPSRPGG